MTYSLGRARGLREWSSNNTGGGRVEPVLVWRGLRYAESTAGENRWRAPVPAGCISGIRDATVTGPGCLQSLMADRNSCPPPGSEDCLTLNVFAPDPRSTVAPVDGFPVMVWIHGGNFEWGNGGDPAHAGHEIAAQGVILVTFNYRVGTMGFLAHPAFASENADGASGNYGVMDQIEALRWVQANIAAFGGDPDNVTIFGQSAGGSSVCYHIASAQSAGLFSRAIIHSGGGCLTIGRDVADAHAEAIFDRVLHEDGVDCRSAPEGVAECLRQRSTCALAAYDSGTYTAGQGDGPATYATIDGKVLTEDPLVTMIRGRHNQVPVIIGATNREEYYIARSSLVSEPITPEDYDAACSEQWKSYSERICSAYPLSTYGSYMDALEFQFSDRKYECAQRRVRHALTRSGTDPVYAYIFADGNSGHDFAYHSADIPYIFATPSAVGTSFDSSDRAEARTLQAYWLQYARSGVPDPPGYPSWAPWTEAGRDRLVFENDSSCTTLSTQSECSDAGCNWIDGICGRFAYGFNGEYRDPLCTEPWGPFLPLCGDGLLQLNEECDDGNDINGDSCSNECTCTTRPTCGDMVCGLCESAYLCPQDCGDNCLQNGIACPMGTTCDTTGTCR